MQAEKQKRYKKPKKERDGQRELRGICPWSLLGEKIKNEKNDWKFLYEAWDRNATREDKKILNQSKAHIQQMRDGRMDWNEGNACLEWDSGRQREERRRLAAEGIPTVSWDRPALVSKKERAGMPTKEGTEAEGEYWCSLQELHYRKSQELQNKTASDKFSSVLSFPVEKSYWFIALLVRPVVSTLF